MDKSLISLRAYNVTEHNDELVFVSMENNIIYSMNRKTKKIRVWDSLPDENIYKDMLYGNIYGWEHGIVLAPLNAENIWIFDITIEEWISIECNELQSQDKLKFLGIVGYKNYVYLLGFYFPGIIKIDLSTKKTSFIDLSRKMKESRYPQNGLFSWDYEIINEILYTPVLCSNEIMKLNLHTDEIEFISVGASTNSFIGLAYDGTKFWLAPRCGDVYCCFYPDENVFEEYHLPEHFIQGGYCFGGAFVYKEKIIFTSFVEKTLAIDINNPCKVEALNRSIFFHKKIVGIGEVCQDKNGNIIIFDDTEIIICGKVEKSVITKIYQKYGNRNNIVKNGEVNECNSFDIEDYIKYITGE